MENQGCCRPSKSQTGILTPQAQALPTQSNRQLGATANNCYPHLGGGCGRGLDQAPWCGLKRVGSHCNCTFLWSWQAAPRLGRATHTHHCLCWAPCISHFFLFFLNCLGWDGKGKVMSKVRNVIFTGFCFCLPLTCSLPPSLTPAFPPSLQTQKGLGDLTSLSGQLGAWRVILAPGVRAGSRGGVTLATAAELEAKRHPSTR